MMRIPRFTFVSEGYPLRRLRVISMKGQFFSLFVVFHNSILVGLRFGGTVKTCTPIAFSRIALFSKQARYVCPVTVPSLVQGGGFEPLDILPAIYGRRLRRPWREHLVF